MVMQEFFKNEPVYWDTQILATDVSEYVLERAREGLYPVESIKNLPPEWRGKHFAPAQEEGVVAISQRLRDEVLFRNHNLVGTDYNFKHKFHFIFCRNVMLYFGEGTKKRLMRNLYNSLKDGGYLFVGASEYIADYEPFTYVKPSIYQKVVHRD